MTAKQNTIMRFANANGGKITKSQAVDLIGYAYHCNSEQHVGAILSRMVKHGLLNRVKPGHFEIGMGKKPVKQKQGTGEPTLF